MKLYRYEDIKKNMIPLSFSNDVWISSAALSLTVPTVEIISKSDYEARLKADMVAMLTDLYMEIEELDTPSNFDSYDAGIVDCEGLIQEKINALKENKE